MTPHEWLLGKESGAFLGTRKASVLRLEKPIIRTIIITAIVPTTRLLLALFLMNIYPQDKAANTGQKQVGAIKLARPVLTKGLL